MKRGSLIWAAAAAAACSPVHDWRDVHADAAGAHAMFPCKPAREQRRVELAGAPVEMTMLACAAGRTTWALGHADVVDPSRVAPALDALRAAAARNIGADAGGAGPFDVRGMTPQPGARRIELAGTRSDGAAVVSHVAVFAKGTRVYQASAIGAQPDAEAVRTFFDGLRFAS